MAKNHGMSEDTKAIIVVLFLIFAYPIGWILMLKWTTWPKWVKWVVSIPVVIFLLMIAWAVLFFVFRLVQVFFFGIPKQ